MLDDEEGRIAHALLEQQLVGLEGPTFPALGQLLDLGVRQSREQDRIAELGEHLGLDALPHAGRVTRAQAGAPGYLRRAQEPARSPPIGDPQSAAWACEYISEPGVVSDSPVSSSVFRPERIIGHPP
mgnify:CR=1 FL=1